MTGKPPVRHTLKVTSVVAGRCRMIVAAVRTLPEGDATTRRISELTGIAKGSISPLIAVVVAQGAIEVADFRTVPGGVGARELVFRLSSVYRTPDAPVYEPPDIGIEAPYVALTSLLPTGDVPGKADPQRSRGTRAWVRRTRPGSGASAKRILAFFMQRSRATFTAHEVSEQLDMSLSTVSANILILVTHGLIRDTKKEQPSKRGGHGRKLYRFRPGRRQNAEHFIATGQLPEL